MTSGREGPAARAAHRVHGLPEQRRRHERTHPMPLDPDDPTGDSAVVAAMRALLTVETRADAARVLHTAIHDLGGAVIPARFATADSIPADVSLGDGEPRVVAVDRTSPAALRLAHHLPALLQDALVAAARCDQARRQAERAAVDTLTGVATRAEIGPRLGLAQPGDVVCLLDLDGFKRLNDTHGHGAGDEALREFGALLRQGCRGSDFCGRYGGDEFLLVLEDTPADVAEHRLRRIARYWAAIDGHGTTVSAGVAVVAEHGGHRAATAADRALYRAKRLGRDRVEHAVAEDFTDDAGGGA